MKKILLALAALIFSAAFSYAQPGPQSLCYTTNGTNCVPAVQASNSKVISISSATTTELVPLVSGKAIYVTSFDIVSTAANTMKFVYGTGTNCGSGTTDLTGAYGMSTFTVITKGNGIGIVLVVPSGNALCVVSTTTGAVNGSVSYAQF